MGSCCSGGEADKYRVRLAGANVINGTYVANGSYGGRRCYVNEQTGMELWYNDGEWRLGRSRDFYYVNKSADQSPPRTGWELADMHANADATRPVPNVSAACCCC